MIDDITQMQDRIADIQSRIDALSAGAAPAAVTAPAGSAAANASFAQTLADQLRASQPGGPDSSPLDVPGLDPLTGLSPSLPGSSWTDPMQTAGRRPYVPAAPPLPPEKQNVAPLAPKMDKLVPIQSGSVDAYTPYIRRYAYENGLSPSLVRAVIQTESGGNPRAVSRAGAKGLMQLMPDNVREAGISDPFDPEQNIAAGTKQLAGLLAEYKGDLDLALAGYNAGPGNVHKYGGVPPFRETRNYIRKVRAAMGDV